MIKGAQPQFATDIQDAGAWKALISAFLESRTDLSRTTLDVTTSSSQVTITISDERVLATLNEIFSSAQATRDSLQYALHEIDAGLSTQLVTSPLFDDSQMRAHEVISHLFSQDLLTECGIDEQLLQNSANDDKRERVFRIPIPKRAGYDLIWQGRATILKAALSPARRGMLMKAFQEGKPFQSSDAVTSNNFTLEPGFEKIVEIQQQADGTKYFAIRYGEYLNLLYPHAPRMENVQNRGSITSVTLDRKALIDYLKYAFQEGFMLAKRQPVLLPSETPLQRANNVYTLVLDCSGSMSSVFSEYKEKVKTLCQQLVNICALGDIIRIVDFDDIVGHDEAWVIREDKNNLPERISRHINNLSPGGGTNLYGTVHRTLNSLKQKYPEYEHCLVVFTDGENTSFKITEQQLIDKIQEQTGLTAKKPPRIFTLGLGERYRREVVERWSKGSGVSHIHLNKMSDFDEIYTQGAKMSRPRLLRHIVQGLFKEAVSVFNDSLTLVDNPLREGEPFQFAEKTYSYASGLRATAGVEQAALMPPAASFTPGYSAANEAQAAATSKEDIVVLDEKLKRLQVTTRPV